MIDTYTSYQLLTRDLGKSLNRVMSQPMVQRETEYYLTNIGKVKSIDEFLDDTRLFNFAMRAHGLEDMAYAKAFMRKALEEGVESPDSFANKLTDKRYAEFVRSFNFAAYGEDATTYNVANQGATERYLTRATAVGLGPAEIHVIEAERYSEGIRDITSIDEFLHKDNAGLLAFALEAYGLQKNFDNKTLLREMLSGGVSDPESPANSHYDYRWSSFVGAFDFAGKGENATVYNPTNHGTTERFLANIAAGGGEPTQGQLDETSFYTQNIGNVKSAIGFLLPENERLLLYAMTAFGLEDSFGDKDLIQEMLEGGISSSGTPANMHEDPRWAQFVGVFNFDLRGDLATTYSAADNGATQRYLIGKPIEGPPAPTYVQEAAYYSQNIASVTSVEQLLDKKNERLLTFALQAFGLEDSIGETKLVREMLEGGIADEDSPANTHDDAMWAEFVRAFDFEKHGEKATTHSLALQPSVDKYIRQTLEMDAGEQNEGVRLALYFERKAPGMTSVYEILADPALSQVARTALGLPETSAQMDVDKQAALLESRIDLEEFNDPEALQKFLTRFTSLWEINNPTQTAQSSIMQLFQPVQMGISADTMMAIANLKR